MGVARRTVTIIPDHYHVEDELGNPYFILVYPRRNRKMVRVEVEERLYMFKIYNFRKRKLRRLNYSYSAFYISRHHYRC